MSAYRVKMDFCNGEIPPAQDGHEEGSRNQRLPTWKRGAIYTGSQVRAMLAEGLIEEIGNEAPESAPAPQREAADGSGGVLDDLPGQEQPEAPQEAESDEEPAEEPAEEEAEEPAEEPAEEEAEEPAEAPAAPRAKNKGKKGK